LTQERNAGEKEKKENLSCHYETEFKVHHDTHLHYIRQSRHGGLIGDNAAVDLHVTQVVDGKKGIHAMLPKAIFGRGL